MGPHRGTFLKSTRYPSAGLSIFEGWKSFSGLERQQLIKLYYFQLFNVFLITALSGSVLNQMQSIIENPSSIINSLAVGLPNVWTPPPPLS
jgi:hypothetical protein